MTFCPRCHSVDVFKEQVRELRLPLETGKTYTAYLREECDLEFSFRTQYGHRILVIDGLERTDIMDTVDIFAMAVHHLYDDDKELNA